MMKKRVSSVCIILVMVLFLLGCFSNYRLAAQAADEKKVIIVSEESRIPQRMLPYTEIEYIDENTYVIHKGGLPEEGIYNENGYTPEEQKEFELKLQEFDKDTPEGLPVFVDEDSYPIQGTYVIYGNDGFPFHTLNQISIQYDPLPSGTTSPIGTYYWDSNKCKLVVSEDYVKGYGQITTFIDVIGERDNVLVKGDCATKGEKDNPTYDTSINVRIINNESGIEESRIMFKRDNGDLPHGVLDIWKTGVQMWNYTYSTYLSFPNSSYSYFR